MSFLRAYAKINLGLRILEKRPDGYHNIETVFHRIDLFDEIELSSSPAIKVVSTSDEAPGDESNICHKAARLLRNHFGIRDGVCISINKKIPVGAGLGGGSSDAATVLRALPAFWNQSIDEESLRSIALQLGSDVPFFLGNGSAVGRGRGEILEYFSLALPYYILLCNPNIHVSTAQAYTKIRPATPDVPISLQEILLAHLHEPARLSELLRNDFESVVFEEYPTIGAVKHAMLEQGAVFALMSGSGSSVFGFFENEATAGRTADRFRSQGYRTFLTKPGFVPRIHEHSIAY
ncbi:MAG: 4-(cytidine 5'-diphospho)-2-C-methyl-D-erythritol kinase [Bacteroidetes bacterium]|nr:4-(cytidine 5'-diphospho)-2-C-methyl-D-erythritol kinase [Bacteroidota bacterium]MCW5895958.1 4-(cytidine 5'-diphospho)-2-C-methyl-D-erythritol kinase [Bacteroidota bacterium]